MKALPEQLLLEQAAHWFITLQEQPDCAKQQQEFKHWLIDVDNKNAWQHICQVEKFFSPINQQIPNSLATQTLLTSSSDVHRNISRRGAIKGLFSLAIASVFTWQAYPWANKHWQYARADYSTRYGEMNNFYLADGSQLWLNTNSAVNVNFSKTVRELTLLQGEIAITTGNTTANSADTASHAKDNRRFLVHTSLAQQPVIIEALGTEFTVQKTAEKITVNVQSGQVALTSGKQRYLINQGQQLVYGAQGTHQAIGKLSAINISVNDWQQGKFTAYNLPLSELCQELARYTPALISVTDDIGKLKVVGTFPVFDTQESMKLLAASLPIELTQRSQWWWLLSAK